MPVTFKSQATGNLVMLSAHAEALLKLLGKTAVEPGILEVADMSHALATLRALDPDQLPDAAVAPALPESSQASDGTQAAQDDKPSLGFPAEPLSLRPRAPRPPPHRRPPGRTRLEPRVPHPGPHRHPAQRHRPLAGRPGGRGGGAGRHPGHLQQRLAACAPHGPAAGSSVPRPTAPWAARPSPSSTSAASAP